MRAVLVTGGTGSFGQAFVRRALRGTRWGDYVRDGGVIEKDPDCPPFAERMEYYDRIIVFSRDELKQAQMAAALTEEFPDAASRLRFFLGDVRDEKRLVTAFHGVETVIHAAALKRVDAVAYNPGEVLKTNVLGTQNVLDAAVASKVGRVIVISSDKAVHPQNMYGASKQMAEYLAVAANSHAVPQGTRVSVVRYGNVLASRGSVVGLWQEARARALAQQPAWTTGLPLTDPEATRFWMTVPQAVQLVVQAGSLMEGGEIFVPVLPAMRIVDLAKALSPGFVLLDQTGYRPGGEKRHEQLLSDEEVSRTVVRVPDQLLVVRPSHASWRSDVMLAECAPLAPRFMYRSDAVSQLSVEGMQALLAGLDP